MQNQIREVLQEFSLIRWIVYTIIGASVNTLALQIFVDYYLEATSQYLLFFGKEMQEFEFLYYFLIPLIILSLIPILLSLILTKIHPEKRIVPPLFIQILTASFFYPISYGRLNVLTTDTVFITSYYLMLSTLIQEKISSTLIGRNSSEESIVVKSLKVHADANCLATIFNMPTFKDLLGLGKKQKKMDERIILRSPKNYRNQTVIELSPIDGCTILNIAFFKQDRYSIRKIEEYANRQFLYLKEILQRFEYSIKIEEINVSTNGERLLYSILDDTKGQTLILEKMSPSGWIKAIAILGTIGTSITLWMLKYLSLEGTLAIIVPAILYAVFEAKANR